MRKEQPAQWMRQKNEFVLAKFSCKYELDDRWNVPFCYGIITILSKMRRKQKKDPAYKNLKSSIDKYEVVDYADPERKKIAGAISLGRSNLRINKQGWLFLHEEPLRRIVAFLRGLFSNVNNQDCGKVIVVGGFSNSEYLVHRLLKEFPDKQFLKPRQPHLAVVRGSLYEICQRNKLRTTRARRSYGIAIDRKFREGIDPESRKIIVPGIGAIVENAFGSLLTRNKEYKDGHTQTFEYWIPADAEYVNIDVYASDDPFIEYVYNEDGRTLSEIEGRKCYKVREFTIKINKITQKKQKFTLKLVYHQTGIEFYYTDPSDELERRGIFDMVQPLRPDILKDSDVDIKESDGSWSCPRCTFSNHSMMMICEMCNAVRPESGINPPRKQSSDTSRFSKIEMQGCRLFAMERDIKPKVIAAVDIGTHATSMGYIICSDEKEDKLLIEDGWHRSGRVKTDILLTNDGETIYGDASSVKFHQIGNKSDSKSDQSDIEEEYLDENRRSGKGSNKSTMLFRRIKSGLYAERYRCITTEQGDINYVYEKDLDDKIRPENSSNTVSTETIFIETFKYIKKRATASLERHEIGSISTTDIQWIFTAPSNWNTRARHKMQRWASDAGLIKQNIDGHIRFLSEAECSSISCQYADIDQGQTAFQVGERYMMIDMGGGMYCTLM